MSWERPTKTKRWWVAFDKTEATNVETREYSSKGKAKQAALEQGAEEENLGYEITRSKTSFDAI